MLESKQIVFFFFFEKQTHILLHNPWQLKKTILFYNHCGDMNTQQLTLALERREKKKNPKLQN